MYSPLLGYSSRGRKLPHWFCVLAYFKVTRLGFWKAQEYVGAKVRFEKLDLERAGEHQRLSIAPGPSGQGIQRPRVLAILPSRKVQCQGLQRGLGLSAAIMAIHQVKREAHVSHGGLNTAFLNTRRSPLSRHHTHSEQTRHKRDLVRTGMIQRAITCLRGDGEGYTNTPHSRRCISRKHWMAGGAVKMRLIHAPTKRCLTGPWSKRGRPLPTKRGLMQPEVDTSSPWQLEEVGTVMIEKAKLNMGLTTPSIARTLPAANINSKQDDRVADPNELPTVVPPSQHSLSSIPEMNPNIA
ncbi:hypothetical protein BDV25DRAFT_135022 [Aspergillus avenaceus]|uniref:Uncharacterized protein n=1 Tax=Aspergillus avenaceus TaxID=36643 RepID=A0A5N6U9I2_ASPAV|nr:hypothetical protein BDV25DRAFT_135022 [Aspergillus avenaceus]